ncbi:MAG: CsiV family protein [Rhodospirillaceae bacterium]|nr:CsiV family protein [Rhodospirillaceae bacterium]MDE0362622.1 CsiV family protein [Rhodospirillaceae bacterium]
MATLGRITVVLLSALQCLSGPALAQNQGIGGFAQAFEGGPDQDEAYPRYRIEVLAFAYNGFDPDEEIFPDEPFQIRLDTRPPTFLNIPTPRPSDLLAALVLAEADQDAGMSESGDSAFATATPEPFGPAPAPAMITPEDTQNPEANTESPEDGAGADTETDAPGGRDIDPDGESDGGPADASTSIPTGGPNGELDGESDGESDSEPAPRSIGPLGPADDSTLRSLLEAAMASGETALQAEDPYPIRSAYLQRLIASLEILEDPSRVPIVFDPIPENLLLPGQDAPESDPLDGGATNSGAIAGDEPEPATSRPGSTFRVLRSDELELRGALQRLQRDAGYTPLAHGGWVQATYPPEQAVPVDISLLGTVNPVGTVTLHLSRFLHVTVDLVYRAPPEPQSIQAAPAADGVLNEMTLPLRYALRIQRRVRSGEVHYLDHPAIGLLVVVTPAPAETQGTGDPLSPPRGPAA